MRSGQTSSAEVERSLRLLPYWWVLRWAWLGEAIWVIYLIETRGLTLGQVLLFDAIFFGSQLLAEIPTGVVADRYGRRTSMLWGSLLTSVAFLIFGLAGTLPLLLAAYVLFGISGALMSGSTSNPRRICSVRCAPEWTGCSCAKVPVREPSCRRSGNRFPTPGNSCARSSTRPVCPTTTGRAASRRGATRSLRSSKAGGRQPDRRSRRSGSSRPFSRRTGGQNAPTRWRDHHASPPGAENV